MISIVDYGLGNVKAIANIYKSLNIPYVAVTTSSELQLATKIVLPGVGAFDDAMSRLKNSGMLEVLNVKVLEEKVPVMGICVGMQMMANGSDEGSCNGLGWLSAHVKLFDRDKISHKPKLPHMGWNETEARYEDPILKGISHTKGFYFLHSYYIDCTDEIALLYANYGHRFACAVRKDNIYGFQFHPEKSHSNGVTLFKNFAEL